MSARPELPYYPQPRPRPQMLEREDKRRAIDAADRKGSEAARKRANGRCEVFVVGEGRCGKRDSQTHHMISGRGRRARGRSALAEHKQRTCDGHHKLITGNVLKVLSEGRLPVWTDPYERIA